MYSVLTSLWLFMHRADDRASAPVEYALIIGIMVVTLVAIAASFDWPMERMVNRVTFHP